MSDKTATIDEVERAHSNRMHPSIEGLLQFFKYDHLPPHLQVASKPFCELAQEMAKLEGPEVAAGLRKLLEAKDCFVRAHLKPVAG